MSDVNTLVLPCYGIVISWFGDDKRGAAISTELTPKIAHPMDTNAMDCIESIVLAHFCAGIDVSSPAYLEGIETAIDSYANNAKDFENSFELKSCDDKDLLKARKKIAEETFAHYDFGDLIVADDSGWEINNNDWSKVVFLDSEKIDDSISGVFELTFADASTIPVLISHRT
jgi:hypothetical protein